MKKLKIIKNFESSKSTKTMQIILNVKLSTFWTSIGLVVYYYMTKKWTSSGQALVSIYKHIQTITNSKNKNKKKKFLNFKFSFLKNQQKTKIPKRYKFYEAKKWQTITAVDQNLDKRCTNSKELKLTYLVNAFT